MSEYKCFQCGFEMETENELENRTCPSCGNTHSLFTHTEMGDIINNIYLAGVDLETFSPLEDY